MGVSLMMLKPAGLHELDAQSAFEIHRRIGAYESAEYLKYLTDCEENRDFNYGNQYTEQEIEDQQNRGQYTLVVNKCRKFINGLVGLVSAQQPKFNVVPRGASDTEVSQLGVQLLDWVWSNSGGLQTFRRAVKMAARDNISYLNVLYDSMGEVKFVPLGYDDVIVDPKSRDPLFRDAEAIYVVRWIPVERVKMLYGVKDVSYDTPVSLASLYSQQGLTPLNPGKLFSDDRQYMKVYEGYKRYPVKDEKTGFSRMVIEKETLLGVFHAYREYLPAEITEYPIVPLYVEDTDNPYKRGEIHFIKGIQRFINKSYGVTILNAQLMSNPKLVVRETDIPEMDKDAFEDNYAKPGSVTVLTGNAQPPMVIQGQPLNTAFFTLYQDSKQELESMTMPQEILGYSDSSQKYQQRGGPTLLEIKEAVLDSIKTFTGNLDAALSQAGLVSLQFCRAYLTGQRTLRIVDAERKYTNLLNLNQIELLQLDKQQSVEAFVRNKKRQGLTDEQIKDMLDTAHRDQKTLGALDYLLNDVSVLDADVLVVPGSYSPSYQMANLRLAMDLQDRGVVDGEAVLEHAPIENKDAIKERVALTQRQAAYIEELEARLEEAERMAGSLRKSVADHEVKSVVQSEKVRQESIYKDLRAKSFVEKQRQKMETREIIREAERQAEDFLGRMKNESSQQDGPSGDGELASLLDLIARG